MRTTLFILAATLLASALPGAARAQEEQEPEIRTITMTTFTIPPGKGQKFMEYVDTYMMPAIKADPHTLGFRIAGHHWGGSDFNTVIISEYESFEGLSLSEEFQDQWFDENYPEDTPEREAADKAAEEDFLPYFVGHTDNIMNANMSRAK
ncbi:MAG: hypothetical protein ACREK5_07495 [Gemmatimonadota bacterium]